MIVPELSAARFTDRALRSFRVNGKHYAQTCEDWLKRQDLQNKGGKSIKLLREDAQAKGIDPIEAEKTFYRFRIFYLACAEFFAHNGGEEWGVGHYLFSRREQ